MSNTYHNHQSASKERAGHIPIEAIETRGNVIDLGVRLALAAIPEPRQTVAETSEQTVASVIPLSPAVVKMADPQVEQARQDLADYWRGQHAA